MESPEHLPRIAEHDSVRVVLFAGDSLLRCEPRPIRCGLRCETIRVAPIRCAKIAGKSGQYIQGLRARPFGRMCFDVHLSDDC